MRSRSRARLTAAQLLFGALATAIFFAPPARSQYLYLDANGDGSYSAADVVAPSGATTVDLWIATDRNRDGSSASCSSEDGALSIGGHEFVLVARNGTVAWGAVENAIPQFLVSAPTSSSPTELHAGFSGGGFLSPGIYRLARVAFTVASGTPSIQVAAVSPSNGAWLTNFVSQCSGLDFDNTLKLGSDWHDVDGLAYGGEVRTPPRMAAIGALSVPEAAVSDIAVTATDEDGDPLRFDASGAPAFVSIATVGPGSGSATGSLHVAPGYLDAGVYPFFVGVTDGEFRDSTTVSLEVPETNRPPLMGRWQHDYYVPIGETSVDFLTPSDPDGQSVAITIVAGPRYMRVERDFSGIVILSFRPGIGDIGATTGTLGASDGYTTVTETFAITVYSLPLVAPLQDVSVAVGEAATQPISASDPDGGTMSLRLGSGPPYVTLSVTESVAGSLRGSIRVAPERYDVGDATAIVVASEEQGETSARFQIHVFDPAGDANAGRPLIASTFAGYDVPMNATGTAWGDFNEDGSPDVAVGAYRGDPLYDPSSPVALRMGRRDGTFTPGVVLTSDGGVRSSEAADFDHDSHLDLLVATERAVYLDRGRGDGSFESPSGVEGEGGYQRLRAGDFNEDGWPDFVVSTASFGVRRIAVFLNDRQGGFVAAPDLVDGGYYPSTVAVADLDRDGHEDLLVGDYDETLIRFWRGLGDGTFGSASLLPAGAQRGAFVVADADADGDPDLCAQDTANGPLRIWENDGAGGLTNRASVDVPPPLGRFALADVDADGDPDIVTLGPSPSGLAVLRGQGPYRFGAPENYRSGGNPSEISIRDVDFDGRPDVVALDLGGGQLVVHRQRPGGSFATLPEVSVPGPPSWIVSGDWDGDGAMDAAVGFSSSPDIHFYVTRSGTLIPLGTATLPATPARVRVADLDGDGAVEVLACADRDVRIFVVRPAATPVVETHAWSQPIADFDVIDWNGDHQMDLVVASRFASLDSTAVLSRSPNGEYEEIARGRGSGSRLACGDFNGDGAVDVALGPTYSTGTALVFWGNGSRTLADAFAYFDEQDVFGDLAVTGPDPMGRQGLIAIPPPGDGAHSVRLFRGGPDFTLSLQGVLRAGEGVHGVAFADLNGDGVADLVTADGRANTISVLPGYPDGTFGRREAFGSGGGPAGVAFADMDGDGRPDVLVANESDQRIAIHRNLGTLRFNHAPTAHAAGPYAGIAGSPIVFDGSASSDPDGDPLTYRWRFGDGIEGAGMQPLHTFAAGGSYRVVLTVSDGTLESTDSTTAIVTALLAAKVFRVGGDAPVVVGAGPPATCLYLEPISGNFAIEDVDPASLRLVATVSGVADSVPATAAKHGSVGDADRDGTPDLSVCFSREALGGLFDAMVGRASVPVTLRGRLFSGAIVEGSATIVVLARGGGLASFVRPQPVSRAGVIGFRLLDAGFASVRLFDAQGRMVRTLLPRSRMAAGYHEVPFESEAGSRSRIPSGVYFYRIETSEGDESGRILLAR